MAIGINGYSDAFKAFADFAQQHVDAGKAIAIAQLVKGTRVVEQGD